MQPTWHAVPGGARLQLWPLRAAYDPDLKLLMVADAHLGKGVAYRRLGLPVPGGTTAEALRRLDALLAATGAIELVFLGDLLHAPGVQASAALQAAVAWRQRHPRLAMTLVRGNHDARAGAPPEALGLQVVDGPWRRGPWALVHEPQAVPGAYALAGHVHPGVVLAGRGRDRLRLPCFHMGPTVGVLPAFGEFTGLHVLPGADQVQRYAVTAEAVVPVPRVPAADAVADAPSDAAGPAAAPP